MSRARAASGQNASQRSVCPGNFCPSPCYQLSLREQYSAQPMGPVLFQFVRVREPEWLSRNRFERISEQNALLFLDAGRPRRIAYFQRGHRALKHAHRLHDGHHILYGGKGSGATHGHAHTSVGEVHSNFEFLVTCKTFGAKLGVFQAGVAHEQASVVI